MNMKYLFLLFLMMFCACSEEEHESEEVRLKSEVKLTELIPNDSYDVETTQIFKYNGDKISSYTVMQEIKNGELFSHSVNTSVAYSGDVVKMKDDNGNVWSYILDEYGHAVSCSLTEGGGTERRYSFSYSTGTDGNHYLKDINETLDDGNVYSSLNLDYSNDGKIIVSQSVDGSPQKYVMELGIDDGLKNEYSMPDLFLSELYPLSMHLTAYYGGILGDAYDYLCAEMYPEDSPELNEHTSYVYSFDETNILNNCKVVTVSAEMKYIRDIDISIVVN